MDGMIKKRNKMKISQSKLAEKIGTTQRIISQIENKKYNATVNMLYRIATELELEVKELF